MCANIRRLTKKLSLVILAILLAGFTCASVDYHRPHQLSSPTCYDPDAYLVLSVEPSYALPDTLVTLHIAYHRIGMPYTFVLIDQPDLVVFDPPMTMPCKYGEDFTGCKAITFRTQSTGVVHFTASAEGEIFGQDCHCWCFTGVQDNGPATLVIADTISHIFLPSVYR